MKIYSQFALSILFAATVCGVGISRLRAQETGSASTPAQAGTSQAPATNEGKFEAISIKVNDSGSGRNSLSPNLDGGRLRAVNVSLATFMVYAYHLPANRIMGGPGWFDSEHFDVDATAAGEDADANRYRIQSMLTDRFKLLTHHETRNLPVYALMLNKVGALGPQLRMTDKSCDTWHQTDLTKPNAASSENSAPDDVNCGSTSGATNNRRARFLGHGVSMDKLLEVLAGSPSHAFVERPIVDRTGVTGNVDFVLEFAMPQLAPSNEQASADPSALPSFTSALREELGLKLESASAQVDVLVIDHVEQPSPN